MKKEGSAISELTVLGTVVIPAYNEANVIARCLDSLLTGFQPGEVDVVIACNGCTDGTADAVRATGHAVRIIEISTASKAAALRAADKTVSVFPIIYLDADVILTSGAAHSVLEWLRSEATPAARPHVEYNTSESDPIVRSYYRARTGVSAVLPVLWGAGVYGLSAEGRRRFGEFPDFTGDDLFVDQHFERTEIAIVGAPPVIVNAPRRTRDLLRILRRTYHGNAENQLVAVDGRSVKSTTPSTVRRLVRLAVRQPARVYDVSTYMLLVVLARVTLALARPTSWERDNSSRLADGLADMTKRL